MRSDDHRANRVRTLVAAACAAAALLLGPATARAATIASGYLWSENAERMICFVWNVSAAPVKVLSAEIVDSSGNDVTTYDNCAGQPLQPGKRCGFQAYGTTQAGGRATLDAPKNRVRGTCQLVAPGVVGITTSDMR